MVGLISTFTVTIVMAQQLLPRNLGIASGLMVGFAVGTGGVGVSILKAIADHFGVENALKSTRILPLAGLLLSLLTCRTVDTTLFAVILEPAGHGLLKSNEALRLAFTADFPFRILPAVIGGKGIVMRVAVDLHRVVALWILEINLDHVEVFVATPSGLSEPESRDNRPEFPDHVAGKFFSELPLGRINSCLIRSKHRLDLH